LLQVNSILLNKDNNIPLNKDNILLSRDNNILLNKDNIPLNKDMDNNTLVSRDMDNNLMEDNKDMELLALFYLSHILDRATVMEECTTDTNLSSLLLTCPLTFNKECEKLPLCSENLTEITVGN